MTKLTILRGISGSGKSTWAETMAVADPSIVIVSRDRIRMSLFGRERGVDEDLVTKVEDSSILAALKAGHNVIVDDTNTRFQYVKRLAKVGWRAGAEVEVKTFDVDLLVAIERNMRRGRAGGRYVPEDVIAKQHQALKATRGMELERVTPPAPYTPPASGVPTFLVDIDGTLAHMGNRRGPFEWHNVGGDDVDEVIADVVASFQYAGYLTIVMSGRDEVCRPETEEWLKYEGIEYDRLLMRPEGDMRPDNLVKAELFDKYIRNEDYHVQFVLDDRDQVVDMWRKMGLTCLQVAEGNF